MNKKLLIRKYIEGTLSQDQEMELLEWIENSNDNKEEFRHLTRSMSPSFLEDERMNRVLDSAKKRVFNKRDKQKIFIHPVFKYAAVLMIGVFISSLFFFVTSKKEIKKSIDTIVVEAPKGDKSKIILPDGSTVWLNSESKLTFNSSFSSGRNVSLKGEGFFDVKHNAKSEFVVKTKAYDVKVHGTKFNVMAYDDFNRTETSLVEGKVEIIKDTKHIDLTPGNRLTYQKGTFKTEKADVQEDTAWKDGVFYFDSVVLNEMIVRLERWYNVEINIRSKELLDYHLSGVFKNEETLDQVLMALSNFVPMKYHWINDRCVVIEKKN